MDLIAVAQFAMMVAGAIVSAPFLYVGLRLFRTDPSEYEIARQQSKSLATVIFGETAARQNHRVSSHVTVEERVGPDGERYAVFLPQGKLSRETVVHLLD